MKRQIRHFEDWYWLNDLSIAFMDKGEYIKPLTKDKKQHFREIAEKAERILNKEGFADKFYQYIAKGFYLLPTPAITNFLDEKESAISCFGSYCPDSVEGLLFTDAEIGMMSKMGGGTSVDLSAVRHEGAPITGGGHADGPMRMIKRLNDTNQWISQKTRRGVTAVYMNAQNKEIHKFLTLMDRTSDIQDVPFGVKLDDEFMNGLKQGNKEYREIWAKIIKKKFEQGFPYLMFTGNIDRAMPQVYKDKGKKINNTNLCTEILLANDELRSFVCDISAINLVHWDELKDTDAIECLVYFLDAVLTDFINKAKDNPLLQRAVKFAEEERAIGVGFSGWHSFLKMNSIAIESLEAKQVNVEVFKELKRQVDEASAKMAIEYGKPLLLQEDKYIYRHSLRMAGAPNTSSSFIVYQWSQSIQPDYSNYFYKAIAKIKTAIKDFFLVELLEKLGKNTDDVWDSIMAKNGSVQHLDFLSEHEKNVFKTFAEISPMDLLILQSQRQKYVDQGISFNTMIPFGTPAKDVSDFYLKAYEMGLKTCYYQLNQNAAQVFNRNINECSSCAG